MFGHLPRWIFILQARALEQGSAHFTGRSMELLLLAVPRLGFGVALLSLALPSRYLVKNFQSDGLVLILSQTVASRSLEIQQHLCRGPAPKPCVYCSWVVCLDVLRALPPWLVYPL